MSHSNHDEARPLSEAGVTNQPSSPQTPQPPRSSRSFSGRKLLFAAAGVLIVGVLIGAAVWYATVPHDVTRADVVTGTMHISYESRKPGNKGNKRAKDVYQVNGIHVRTDDASRITYEGTITQGYLLAEGPDRDNFGLTFNLALRSEALDGSGKPKPNGAKELAGLSGRVLIDDKGMYEFGGLKQTTDLGESSFLEGKVQGRRSGEAEPQPRQLRFPGSGRDVIVDIKDNDPIVFLDWLKLPPGVPGSTPLTMRGELTYDYGSSRYYTNDLSFDYGKKRDRVSGTIFWKKDQKFYLPEGCKEGDSVPDQFGKSEYRVTFVFEPWREPGTGAADVIDPDKEKLIELKPSMSYLSGSINYVDTGIVKMEKDGTPSITPYSSKVTFALDANRLEPHQVHGFVKLWLLMVKSFNDE